MFPKANKTQMIKFLRTKGYDVAHTRTAQFFKERNAFWLEYLDSSGSWHTAYYSACCGRPIFSVDRNFIDVSFADIKALGMYRLAGGVVK